MKQYAVLLYTLILMLPIASAETKIFSGRILTGSEKDIDGGIFKLAYDSQSNKVFVGTPSTGLIVDNGACKSNNVFRVCIDAANFSHKNITTQVYYYDVSTTIYKLTGSLGAVATITSSSLLQGESAELKVAITNPTSFEITDVVFYHDLGSFAIEKLEGCSLSGNSMAWQGSLKPGFDRVCTAKIVSFDDGTYKLSGSLSYFNSYEKETKSTGTITIKVLPKQLNAKHAVDQYIEIKQPFYYNLSLNNINVNEELDASVVLEFPSNVRLLKDTSGFLKGDNILKHNTRLQPGAWENYSLYLEATSEGGFPIKQSLVYTIKNVKDNIENKTFINIIDPKPVIELISEYDKLIPGQKFIVIVNLKNPSKFHELTDMDIKLSVPYNNIIKDSRRRLKPNESYSSISRTFIIPDGIGIDADSEVLMGINLSVVYTLEGMKKSTSKSLDITLKKELAEDEAANQSVLKEADDIQIAQVMSNNSAEAEAQSSNISKKEPIMITETLISRLLNKDILLMISAILATFIIIIFIIMRARKKKIKTKTI